VRVEINDGCRERIGGLEKARAAASAENWLISSYWWLKVRRLLRLTEAAKYLKRIVMLYP